MLLLPAQAIGQLERETAFKAASLFHLAQFTEWPASAFTAPESPIVIGILGADPFGASFDAAVENKRVGNRPLKVERFQTVSQIEICHILYISSSANARLDEVLRSLQSRSILTVSDTENFARRGGTIEFFAQNDRIRLRINLAAVRASGLEISSKLLRWVEVINPNTQQAAR